MKAARRRRATSCRRFRIEPLEPKVVLAGAPVISEMMALNSSTLADEDGEFSDWIELFNAGDAPVDLAGYYLTDDAGDATKWALPAETLDTGEHLLVFASSKNRAVVGQPLHTNFALSGGGEFLGLYDGASFVSQFTPEFPEQVADISYGLAPEFASTALIEAGDAGRVWVPTEEEMDASWSDPGFDDGTWDPATTGVGFDVEGDYDSLIATDLQADMLDTNSSALLRMPFEVDDPGALDELPLRMKYDDGFIAYLNGHPVASRNAPGGVVDSVDEALTNTSQIRSATNDPPFLFTENVAAVNLHFGTAASGTLNGIGFHNLNLAANPQSGSGIAPDNAAAGVTFDFSFGCNADCPGARNLATSIGGTDAAVANSLTAGNRYLSATTDHRPNIMTFHGLGGDRPLYVQMIGGQHGWNGNTSVFVNGDGVTEGSGTLVTDNWSSNQTGNTNAGLLGFATTSTAAGELTLELQTDFFSGISAVIISGQTDTAPESGSPQLEPVDTLLSDTSQISTASHRPYFAYAENLAAVNFHNAGSGDPGNGRVHGVGFDNITLPTGATGTIDTATDIALTKNKPGVTFDYAISRHGASTVGAAVTGAGAATLNAVLSRVKPVDDPVHGVASTFDVTFENLGASRNVFVQLLGGDAGWSADADVFLNGSATAHTRWEAVADVNGSTPSLKSFEATTDAAGNLRIELEAVPGVGGNTHFFGIAGAIVTGELSSAPTGLIVDDPLTDSSQLRSATVNPPFAWTDVAAGVNFYYSGGGTRASDPVTSGTVNGIALDNIDLWDADALNGVPFSVPVAANEPGVTLEVNMPHAGDPLGRTVSVATTGPDSAALDEMIGGMRYMSDSVHVAQHLPNRLTFSNLTPDRDVYVQLVGGSDGWNGAPDIFVNGAATPIGVWTDNPGGNTEASIAGFYATTDPTGDLAVELVVPSTTSPFAGLSGIVVLEKVSDDPPPPMGLWNLAATGERSDINAVMFETIDLSEFIGHLNPGPGNVLAVHGLNAAADDSDFLIVPELEGVTVTGLSENLRYFATPTPGEMNNTGFVDFVADTTFDVDRGFYDAPFDVHITAATPGATIVFTTDSTKPALDNGTVVAAPDAETPPTAIVAVSTTTTLRAAAFKENYRASNVDTHTYVFADHVRNQVRPPEYPEILAGVEGDYEVDPEIVGPGAPWENDLVGSLVAIPTMSIVLPDDDMFGPAGLYENPQSRGDAWEREASIEYFDPASGGQFQENAGLRIQGNSARNPLRSPKHPFRITFRGEYGATKLEFPVFGDGVEVIDKLVLRSNSFDGWTDDVGDRRRTAQFLRDEFWRVLSEQMGQPAVRGDYVHLYLNGMYWGVYNVVERPDADWAAELFGGDADTDYDIRKTFGEFPDGDATAWDTMMALANAGLASDADYQFIQGNNPDGARNPAYDVLLDVPNLIDYILTNIYGGCLDWPANYYAFRDRTDQSTGYKFLNWDSELVMLNGGLGDGVSRLITNYVDRDSNNTPARLFQALRANEEFRVLVGDHVQRHFFNGGAMTPESLIATYEQLADALEPALVGESARWGDHRRDVLPRASGPYELYTPDYWVAEKQDLIDNYFPLRSGIVVDQLAAGGLYPDVGAPVFNQHGGVVPPGFLLNMTGAIEPVFDETVLVATAAPATALVPTNGSLDPAVPGDPPIWTTSSFDDALWSSGTGGVGYEDAASGYAALIGLDIQNAWDAPGAESSVYTRFKFTLDAELDPLEFDALTLDIQYDDGFVAYLNGMEVASRFAPQTPVWNSPTDGGGSGEPASESIDLTAFLGLLAPGDNVLAIHGLNVSTGSSDMLIRPELTIGVEQAATSPPIYFTTDGGDPRLAGGAVNTASATLFAADVSIDDTTVVKARSLVGGEWSALTEAVFVVNPATSDNVVISEINFNPAAPTTGELAQDPLLGNDDFEFVELTNISAEAVSLADVAFAAGDPVEFAFGDGSIFTLGAGESVLVVRDLDAFRIRYGTGLDDRIAGVFADGGLNNGGEQITLLGRDGDVIRSFAFDDTAPWPNTADGLGFSLVLEDPASNPDHANPFNWRASAALGGSPGAIDPAGPAAIVINEALSNSDAALLDSIELFNPTGGDVNVGGWFLTDDESLPQKYQIADSTIIPAGGYLTFDETHFNASGGVDPNDFALSATGDEAFLFSADPTTDALTGYVHGFAFGAAANNVAFIRHVDSTGYEHFTAQADPGTSLGGANEPFRVGEVVITELHYNPKTIDPLEPFVDEFIEIQNISDDAVPLFDPDNPANTWVARGAAFAFPPATSLAPGETALVVAIDPEAFRTTYSLPAELQMFGPFLGSLSDGGETISLQRPTAPSPEAPLIVPLIDVDVVRFDDDSPWTTLPDGGNGDGSSLNRIAAENFGSEPLSWTAAEPTPGTAFTVRHVVGRHLFYNDSAYDTLGDADAIAVDKSPLLPGETATPKNYSSYQHGINGLIVDLLNPTATPTAGDFAFRVGNDSDTASWQPAPPTVSFTVTAGGGEFGATRVTITWANGAIAGQWLETTIAASLTGTTADVFYYGSAIGETGNDASNALVTAADLIAIRNNPRGEGNRADITSPHDINRDRLVDAADQLLARNHATGPFDALRWITPPVVIPPPAPAEGAADVHVALPVVLQDSVLQPSKRERSAHDAGNDAAAVVALDALFSALDTILPDAFAS